MLPTLSCYGFSSALLFVFWTLFSSFIRSIIVTLLSFGSAAFIWILMSRIFDRILPRRKVSPLNKAVFITGCDTGFGHLLAKRLDLKGYKVFAGCLKPEGPDAERLKMATSSNLSIIDVDVTSDESVQNAFRSVNKKLNNSKLWAVVNNAGVGMIAEAGWLRLEDYKMLFEVNTFGVVRVTQAFLPLLRKCKGRVVTTTSHAGRISTPPFVPYSMTKYAATSFCEGLRIELEKWNIKVITVEPFMFRTPITERKRTADIMESAWGKVPEEVKKEYGPHYIDKFKESALKFMQNASPSVNKVIDCLEEAVTAVSPHYSYTPADRMHIIGDWFLESLPLTIRNKITKTFLQFT